MSDILQSTAMLVHMASLLYVIAFLVRDQLWLRILVLVATALYIGYYYFVPAEPLWDAIIWSIILGAANLYILAQIILERTTLNLSEDERELFTHFHTMMPGEFRRLLKIAEWKTVTDEMQLTELDEPPTCLHFVLRGQAQVIKENRTFDLPAPKFIGEVAFFLNRSASATVVAAKGSTVISWDRETLDKLLVKRPAIRVALHSLLNADMAEKVAAS